MAFTGKFKSKHSNHLKVLGALTMLFVLSRVLMFLAGIRFETWGNRLIMHFVHPSMLRTNLLESVFHLHSQPPLFNLFIGIVIKLFTQNIPLAFQSCYLVCGLLLTWSLYILMARTGVSSRLAGILTSLFMISPATILFENILLYTYPVVALLSLSGVVLFSFLENGRFRDGLVFFLLLMLISLTRSLYHLVWIVAATGVLIILQRNMWKTILKTALLPLLVVFALYAKNYVLFGTFSSSTWMGMSFFKMTTHILPEEKRLELIGTGKVSELAVLPSYRGLWYYRDRIDLPSFEKTGIPILDLEHYSTGGLNYNNLSYISLSSQYMKDALYVLSHYPSTFIKGLISSFKIYFYPSSDWFAMMDETNKNRKVLQPYIAPLNMMVCGQIFNTNDPTFSPEYTWQQYTQPAGKIGLCIVVWVLVSFVFGGLYNINEIRTKGWNSARAGTMAYLLIAIVYVTLVGNCLEVGENHRFRYNINPFLLVFFGLFLQDMTVRFRKNRNKSTPAGRRQKSKKPR